MLFVIYRTVGKDYFVGTKVQTTDPAKQISSQELGRDFLRF